MRPIEWVKSLLSRHGLQRADGRPLYQYRISDAEFSELTEMLKLSTIMGVKNIRQMFFWDAAFVIYSSEWWRRYYKGHWGWDGIFNSIGIDFNDLSVGNRNTLIETGLQRWHRNIRYHNGSRMLLGTVATEGGLPLNQLSGSGGWLKHILQPVLRKHISRGINVSVLVDSYSDVIPNSYKSSEMTQILADIAEIVIMLRQEHQLMEKEAPLKWLDANQPNWRELFPLPIDDASGRSLLKDLVDTVSTTEHEQKSKNPFEVERFLVRAESLSPELVALLEMPTFISLRSLGLEASEINLPATFNVEVFEPNGSIWPWCRGILTSYKEKLALKLSGRSLRLLGVDATKELRLRFTSMGETVLEQELIGGYHLDTELPWLFRQVDSQWMLHGTASQSVKDKNAIAFIPSIYSHKGEDETTEIVNLGHLFSDNIYMITGSAICYTDEIKYKLSAGVDESIVHYHLSGQLHPYDSVPREIFIGIPDLVQRNLITGTSLRKKSYQLLAKPLGVDTAWRPLSQVDTGYYELRLYDTDGYIKLRKRVGILNSDFSFNICPDKNDVSSGCIHNESVENCQINVGSKDVLTHINQSGTSTVIQLKAESSPPLSVNISLLPKKQHRELLLKFPFPSKGALLFDQNGQLIPFSSQLFLSNLKGYRIKVFDEKFNLMKQVELTFSLIDPSIAPINLHDLYIRKKMRLKGEMTEFSIYNWMESIDSLMSISTSLDSMVRITMNLHGHEEFRLDIRRYENEISAHWNEGIIEFDSKKVKQLTIDILEKTKVSALFLNQPEQDNSNLTALSSENTLIGRWNFAPEKRQAGPWLIYPHADSQVKFRPLLWNVGISEGMFVFNLSDIDTLPKAICVPDQELRNSSIHQVLRLMAGDLKHKSWAYLDNLWQKTSHLPMSTFDVWKVTVNETRFLACLFILERHDIIERFEMELPLIWELVQLKDWENALKAYQNKLSMTLGEEDKELINELLQKKIIKIESLGISMVSIGQILRKNILNEKTLAQEVMQQKGTDFFRDYLLNPIFQEILRRHSGNEWPTVLSTTINQRYQKLPSNYSELLQTYQPFQNSVVYLPLILAVRVLSTNEQNWPSSTTELFKIQELKRFDEDWFSTVFQLLSGWISQQNNLESV